MASVILGDWTHRRGDPGGARAVTAEIDRPRPATVWSWVPEHDGRVDQVRVAGASIFVATMTPRDPVAPGWEHAVVYALDAATGAEVARRELPDPVPVAAMVIESGCVHVIAARRGEPIYWYGLSSTDLSPAFRRPMTIEGAPRPEDVLDAWATPRGGLWLELDGPAPSTRSQTFAYAEAGGEHAANRLCRERGVGDRPPPAGDACAGGDELYVPLGGRWASGEACAPASLRRLDPGQGDLSGRWAEARLVGPRARVHALSTPGIVVVVGAAEDPQRPERASVEAFAIDMSSGLLKWRVQDDRVTLRAALGDVARTACRPNGEILYQGLGADGTPSTPIVCLGSDGHIDSVLPGARGRYVLDAALGPLVLAHCENKNGHVEVCGFAIDGEGRLLGRRAVVGWTIDAGDLGGATTVYAGAGVVVVRGRRGLRAIRL